MAVELNKHYRWGCYIVVPYHPRQEGGYYAHVKRQIKPTTDNTHSHGEAVTVHDHSLHAVRLENLFRGDRFTFLGAEGEHRIVGTEGDNIRVKPINKIIDAHSYPLLSKETIVKVTHLESAPKPTYVGIDLAQEGADETIKSFYNLGDQSPEQAIDTEIIKFTDAVNQAVKELTETLGAILEATNNRDAYKAYARYKMAMADVSYEVEVKDDDS